MSGFSWSVPLQTATPLHWLRHPVAQVDVSHGTAGRAWRLQRDSNPRFGLERVVSSSVVTRTYALVATSGCHGAFEFDSTQRLRGNDHLSPAISERRREVQRPPTAAAPFQRDMTRQGTLKWTPRGGAAKIGWPPRAVRPAALPAGQAGPRSGQDHPLTRTRSRARGQRGARSRPRSPPWR